MKRLIPILLAGLIGGCLPYTPGEPAPWAKNLKKDDEKKSDDDTKVVEPKAEGKTAPKLPAVTSEGMNEINALQRAEAMDAEMNRDLANPPKVIVHAKK